MNNDPHPKMSQSRFPDGFRLLNGSREYVTYIEHSSLRVWYDDTPRAFEPHFHSAVEIIMPLRGEVVYTVSEFSYHVQADEVLIIPPNWEHSLTMRQGSARYLFLFEPEAIFSMRDMPLIEELLRIPLYISEQPEAQQSIRALLMQIVNCYEKKEFLWNSICYSYLLQLYAKVGQLNMSLDTHRPDIHSTNGNPEIIDSARSYIDTNYMRDISLDDVSAFTGFSRSYLSRIFKKQYGVSFSEYLRGRRISAASQMLMHTLMPVNKIAKESGFGSITTFNRIFREAQNCSPTRYRDIYGDIHKSESSKR